MQAPQAPTPFTRIDDFTALKGIPAGNLFVRAPNGLFKNKKNTPEVYSPEHWFMYFWQEAQGAWADKGTAKKADQVVAFFNTAFQKDADWPVRKRGEAPPQVSLDDPPLIPKGRFEEVFKDDELCEYLELFLNIGFDWYSEQGCSETGVDHLRYIKMIDQKIGFEIRWRGESSRDLATVLKQGYAKQALIEKLKKDCNLGASWHPFSKEANNSKFWFRKTNGDNDWYTVVSVATDWRVSLGFPKIEQTPKLQILSANQVIDGKFQVRHPELIGEVEFADGQKEWRMITRSKIALLLVDTLYFDTQARQKKGGVAFPEHGAAVIPGENVMGMVEFIRVHHGHDDDAGFTAVLDRGRSKQVFKNNQGFVNRLLQVLGNAEAASRFSADLTKCWNDASHTKAIHMRWDANGFVELTAPARTRGIRTIRLQNERIY
jgi:hypothetical protein